MSLVIHLFAYFDYVANYLNKQEIYFLNNKNNGNIFLNRRQPGPIRSVLLVIIGWLVGWLVGDAVFSETALRIFLIFCMKLGNCEGRKATEPVF